MELLPDVLILLNPAGIKCWYFVSDIAHYRHVDNPFFYYWFLNISTWTDCFHCGGKHNPFVCPNKVCEYCGVMGHYDVICPNAISEHLENEQEIDIYIEETVLVELDRKLEATYYADVPSGYAVVNDLIV